MMRIARAAAAAAALVGLGMACALPAQAVSTKCTNGTFRGTVSTSLQNGNINTAFCDYGDNVGQVNSEYVKLSGSGVYLRNFWEWTNPNGGTSMAGWRYYDKGQFFAIAGNRYPYTWKYAYPGKNEPNSSDDCVRGGVKQMSNGQLFTTRVLCI